jgi:hypothetical protein
LPQFGQRRQLSRSLSGKFAPRVQINVFMSSSAVVSHSVRTVRLDMDTGSEAPPYDHPLVAGENAAVDLFADLLLN